MYKGKKILALITARGGSKGIPKKNIIALGGKPLIGWTIEAALQSHFIDRLILSSDDQEIIAIARSFKCEAPFTRPDYLAQDDTSSMDVIMHAIEHVKGAYDYLLLLQPTSPFRTSEDIDNIIRSCLGSGFEMMISVAKLKKHPMYMYKIKKQRLESFLPAERQLRRQDMPSAYEHNGALYLSSIKFLKKVKSFNVNEARAFEMYGAANIDIDNYVDLHYAEFLIEKGMINNSG